MRFISVLSAGAVALAFSGAAPVFATQAYVCSFTQECIAGETCKARDDLTAGLDHDAQGWVMSLPDGESVTFSDLAGAPEGTLRLISIDFDPDAAATALLYVAGDGQAILSYQGYFFTLVAATLLGQCTPKGE